MKKFYNSNDTLTSIGILILSIILITALEPLISFLCGWLIGLMFKFIFGNIIVGTINVFLNRNFTIDILPPLFATISVFATIVGNQFKNFKK